MHALIAAMRRCLLVLAVALLPGCKAKQLVTVPDSCDDGPDADHALAAWVLATDDKNVVQLDLAAGCLTRACEKNGEAACDALRLICEDPANMAEPMRGSIVASTGCLAERERSARGGRP